VPNGSEGASLPYGGEARLIAAAIGQVAPAAEASDMADGRYEIRLSGSGGQGLILAAVILAEAAVSLGKEVVQSQSYGPEARGGASQAAVIISDHEIDYPEVESADITLCLSQPAFDKFAPQTRPGGLVLYDSGLVSPETIGGVRQLGLPFTQTAQSQTGTPMAANVVSLGAIVALMPAVERQALADSVSKRLPAKLVEANLRALAAGAALAEEAGAATQAVASAGATGPGS
jgi:2-oxoglutarate ferredoxin oxidoreductase subunit gamma